MRECLNVIGAVTALAPEKELLALDEELLAMVSGGAFPGFDPDG
jgi:hypothetical protein